MLESSFFVCPLSCKFVFLVTISIFSAPERSLWGPVDHQVHPCFSLLSVTVHQLSTQPASSVCRAWARAHTTMRAHPHTYTHIKTCTYKHRCSNSPTVSLSSSPETDFYLIGGTLCLVPHHPGHLPCSSCMTLKRKDETQSLECTINKYLIAGLTLTHF